MAKGPEYWQGWLDCIDYMVRSWCTEELPEKTRVLMRQLKEKIDGNDKRLKDKVQ